jgi:CheY-like chemotaxis protein
VVEDNPVNQMVARRMLENNGYRAELADNGVAALRVLETENARFDLILMDVQMPEMDGFEATARIRLFENGSRHTPIIAMTANAMSGDRERCLAAGMDDYLSKPLTMKALHEKVSRWTAAPAQSIPA